MAVDYDNLTIDALDEMGYRETIQNVPCPDYTTDSESLTKTQLLTLIMIDNSSTKGYGQIRHYTGMTLAKGNYIPTESVPRALDEKGYAKVKRKKQVSRRTGRTPSGFEKKKEGGYVNCYRSDDVLDEIAEKLGYDGRHDDGFHDMAVQMLQDHPQARDR